MKEEYYPNGEQKWAQVACTLPTKPDRGRTCSTSSLSIRRWADAVLSRLIQQNGKTFLFLAGSHISQRNNKWRKKGKWQLWYSPICTQAQNIQERLGQKNFTSLPEKKTVEDSKSRKRRAVLIAGISTGIYYPHCDKGDNLSLWNLKSGL